jgi:hypothetical protein
MKRLLRGLEGPCGGTTFELGPRTIIGRAADADIQVLDPSVSRQHAKVVVRDDGTVALIDLGSANGTFVDNLDVDRVRLRPGNVIEIVGARFEYQEFPETAAEVRALRRGDDKVLSGRSLRRTAPGLPLSSSQQALSEAKTRVGPPDRRRPGAPIPVSRDDALTLLDEVLDYRELRVKQLRGESLLPLEDSRLDRLRQKLHRRLDGRHPSRRRFQRFSCELDAEIGRDDGTQIHHRQAPVTDLGAGGAQIALPTDEVAPGEIVWLTVDVSELYQSTPCVVFKTRVAWLHTDEPRVGLVFAGQARYARDASSVIAARRGSIAAVPGFPKA